MSIKGEEIIETGRRRRRQHSALFKAEAVEGMPGAGRFGRGGGSGTRPERELAAQLDKAGGTGEDGNRDTAAQSEFRCAA